MQREATLAPDGPLAIVAGPGSGKTRVLAARIGHLVTTRGIPPDRVLALTFSRKAALEMRLRVAAFLGNKGMAVDVATFHAFGLRVVRDWSRELGFPAGRVGHAASAIAQHLLGEAATDLGLDLRGMPTVSDSGGRVVALAESVARHRLDPAGAPVPSPIAALAAEYERRLIRAGLVDFPGMLVLPLRLFTWHRPALEHYRDRYRHILCDEVQDVDPAQAALLGLLAAGHGNLTVVGDPLQALYAFRGATGAFLRDFPRRYPRGRTVCLDENFRSTGTIVALANALSAGLPYGQRLVTANDAGPPVMRYDARDDDDEAAFVVAEIERLLRRGLVRHAGEVAVLARTNRQLAALASALRARGLEATRREQETPADRVQLTTIHRAKGAEWRAVFVVGLEEGIIPSCHAVRSGDPVDLANEHHAAYVAVTRSREHLFLSMCRRRARAEGEPPRACWPSRYLDALDAAALAATRPPQDRPAA